MTNIEDFPKRLTTLRMQRGISAREMSLSLGQNAGDINNIESGKTYPSMISFFYICEFLKITPHEFFDLSTDDPEEIRKVTDNLKRLNPKTLSSIDFIVSNLARNNKH